MRLGKGVEDGAKTDTVRADSRAHIEERDVPGHAPESGPLQQLISQLAPHDTGAVTDFDERVECARHRKYGIIRVRLVRARPALIVWGARERRARIVVMIVRPDPRRASLVVIRRKAALATSLHCRKEPATPLQICRMRHVGIDGVGVNAGAFGESKVPN